MLTYLSCCSTGSGASGTPTPTAGPTPDGASTVTQDPALVTDGNSANTAGDNSFGMLVPMIASSGIFLGALAAGIVSCARRRRRNGEAGKKYKTDKSGRVIPVDGNDAGDADDDDEPPESVVRRVEAELRNCDEAEAAGIANINQWHADALRRWLNRAGVAWSEGQDRSLVSGRGVCFAWL